MEKNELGKLKKLLSTTELKKPNMSNEELYAWYLILEPYSYDDIRNAILELARTSPFSPHPGEIARMIQPERTEKPKQYSPAMSADEHYRYLADVYAKIAGIRPPSQQEDPLAWFRRERDAKRSNRAGSYC